MDFFLREKTANVRAGSELIWGQRGGSDDDFECVVIM